MIRSIKSAGNTVYVLHSLIKRLNIPVSSYTIEKDLLDHPDYPSMLSLMDCLTTWNVPNEAFKLDKETCDLKGLSFPFIAHLNRAGGEFVLVQGIENDMVKFNTEKEKQGALNQSEFLKFWDGMILYAEKDEASGENEYKQSLIKGWLNEAHLPFLVLLLLCSIFYAIDFGSASPSYLGLIFINLAGVGVSGLLLMHSINANNPFIQNLCSLGKKNNCNAILKSDAAKVTSWLSWSEVGMFYFAGSLIYLLLNPSGIVVLSWLNILCLPYTVYSIGYQLKIKTWCILCCSIQALLWMEAVVFFVDGTSFQALSMGFSEMIHISLCFLVPVAIWAFIKPYLLKSEHLNPLKQQLKKFKYNSTLFNQLLSGQAKYSIPDDLMPIVLGNPEAANVITMVSNPFCGPCGTAHQTLDKWLQEREDIQVKVVFTASGHDDEQKTAVSQHLSALTLLNDVELLEKALNDWYKFKMDYKTLVIQYPVSFNERMNIVTKKQKEWCDRVEITFTPTILVNGHKLPEPYRLEDIKYLIE